MKVYPYNPGSRSAKALAEALGCKRIKHEGKKLLVRGGIINWGASRFTRNIAHDGVLNSPDCVAVAANKLQTFKTLSGHVPIPEWTEEPVEASRWLAEGFTVVCRLKLNGHSGEGIVLVEEGELPKAPLYTKYVHKRRELRIHVFRESAFFVQEKKRNKDVADDNVNWKIRNHGNGFIYANQDIVVPDDWKQSAVKAVAALGLDFGAVDMVWNEKTNKHYVLEVNTACGLEGTTLEKYVEQFRKFV